MASETQFKPSSFPPAEDWPPDDTEESIVGTDLHQMTIMNLRLGINEIAHLQRASDRPLPWHALSQILLLGGERQSGTEYRLMPDVFVYPHTIDQKRGSVALQVDGPPFLIIEVLSDSTYANDLDLTHGKGWTYARAGVREYLTVDPLRAVLHEGLRGWQLVDGAYKRWDPDDDGRWHSREIAVAFGLEGMLATVYTQDGRRQLHEGEIGAELQRRDAELERRDAEIARLRRLLDERGS